MIGFWLDVIASTGMWLSAIFCYLIAHRCPLMYGAAIASVVVATALGLRAWWGLAT